MRSDNNQMYDTVNRLTEAMVSSPILDQEVETTARGTARREEYISTYMLIGDCLDNNRSEDLMKDSAVLNNININNASNNRAARHSSI